MNKLSLDEAKRLVHESLGISYKEEKFRQFAANILQHASCDINDEINSEYLPNAFQQQFYSYKNLAQMRGKENIDILAVKMKSPGSMLNARATQRLFIGHYLNGIFDGTVKDAALVAFYCDHAPDWRLSLVYKDYSFENDNIKITLTEPRRSSFLVGPNELTHTAERQFVDLLQDEDRDNIKRLKEAFSVERVTSEFFAEYKKLFQLLTEKVEICLKESTNAREEFGRCGINPTVYAKRLLGQIIFLYFLQKKGWLGVSETERWGDGSPSFLRDLFNNFQYKNFFSDLLNPLFYEAIATDRSKQNHRFDLLHCRIPFLNGGLFEPIGGHDWRKADIFIDNEFFKKLFQTFDRYNFTVREDEPLESEVAVDPEMLGKVFESLLGVEERREQGTFYTPRRIVHYMCRESLIRYLDHSINYTLEYSSPKQLLPGVQPRIKQRTLPNVPIPGQIPHLVRREIIPINDIIQFIRQDEIQHNTEEDTSQTYSKEYSLDQNKKLPQSVLIHAKILDNALANVKICDPAIGSGAFAVGMMLEIVHARQSLHQIRPEFFGGESDGSGLPSSYELKRNTIGKSLYGVDKDESAVDIAKLRLWLSLVVDEENFERNPHCRHTECQIPEKYQDKHTES